MRLPILLMLTTAGLSTGLTSQSFAQESVSLGLTGGGLQGLTDSQAYAINSNRSTIPPNGDAQKVRSTYQFGGGAYLKYSKIDYDLKLDYFNASNHADAFTTQPGLVGSTLLPASWVINYTDSAHSKVAYNFNQLDLSAGFEWQATRSLMIHPNIGLMYLSLGNNQYTTYTGQDAGLAIANANQTSSFKGFGPSLGLDIKKNIFYPNLSAFVNLAYTPAIGRIRSQYSANISDDSVFPAFVSSKTNTVVMNYQSELGLGYEFNQTYHNVAGSIMLGYRVNYLVGASQTENLIDSSAGTNLMSSTHNFALQGVFLRLVLKTDVPGHHTTK